MGRLQRSLRKQAKEEQMQTEDPLGYWAYRGGRQVSRWIQKMDQFGQPITLSFQGRAHYTTCPTGFMTLFIILATLFFTIGELDKLIQTETVALGYFDQLATPDEAGLNYTLSDAENMTMSLEFQPIGSWVNEDGVTNRTIKERVHELAKMIDVTAAIYNRNTSRGTAAKRIGWPILQENFTEVLSINSHENWEMKVDLQDMIMSGSSDFYNQINYFSTKYDFQLNKYKMYREAYFRCLSKKSCGGLLPDEGEMVNAEFDYINTNPYLSTQLKQIIGDQIQRAIDADPRKADYYQFVHDYLTITKTVPNVPTSTDILYVTVNGARANVMNKGSPATVPGFEATKKVPRYADATLYEEYKVIWTELEKEVNDFGKNFSLNVLLYDETEDYYDTELKYPYRKRRSKLGTFTVDLTTTSFDAFTSYFKKSEVCEEKPDWSKKVSKVVDKDKKGYQASKQCLYQKIKHDRVVGTKPRADSAQSQAKIFAEFDFLFDPMISTLVVRRQAGGSALMDVLVSIGGFIALLWFIIMPIGKNISGKLYDANLISSLYLSKGQPETIALSREELKKMEEEQPQALQDPNSKQKGPYQHFQNLDQQSQEQSVEMEGGVPEEVGQIQMMAQQPGETEAMRADFENDTRIAMKAANPKAAQQMLDTMQKSFNKIKMTTSQIIFDPIMQVCLWRRKGRDARQRQAILDAGRDKKAKQMDLVNVMHKINFSYDILRNFVTKDQKRLLHFNKSQVIDVYDMDDNGSSSDPDYAGKKSIKKKVKASKLQQPSEQGFLQKVNDSLISGLSLHKAARNDLTNMISKRRVEPAIPLEQNNTGLAEDLQGATITLTARGPEVRQPKLADDFKEFNDSINKNDARTVDIMTKQSQVAPVVKKQLQNQSQNAPLAADNLANGGKPNKSTYSIPPDDDQLKSEKAKQEDENDIIVQQFIQESEVKK